MTTIILADDHNVVRQGLRALLEAEPDFAVVGEAADGLEVDDLVERLQPDVLVLDLMMPGMGGLEVTRQLGKHSPQTHVLILSMYSDEAYVMEALRNGAAGYALKKSTRGQLVQAVREVAQGRRYLSPPFSERAIEAYLQKAESALLDIHETLTTRERQVLQLSAEGRNNTEISDQLSISPRTAETHSRNLMRKLGLRTQTNLIRYALRRGILPAEG